MENVQSNGLPPVPPSVTYGESSPIKRISLQAYLGITLSVLIFALSIFLAGILDGFVRREILQLAEQNLETVSRQMARELATGMDVFGREVQTLANTGVFQDPDASPKTMRHVLDKFAQQHPEFVFIGIVDMATDKVFASNGALFEGGSAKGRPAYEMAKTRPFLGDVHEAVRLAELLPKSVNGDPLRFFDASAPVMDKSGKPFRVLAGHISAQWTEQVRQLVLAPLAKDQHIELVLVDTAGKVVLSPDAAIKTGTPINAITENVSARHAVVQRWANGQDYLTVSAPVKPHGAFDGFGWKVMARQPTDVAFAPATILRNSVFAGALVLASIAASLAWLIAGRIAQPVRKLANSAENIASNLASSANFDLPIGELASVHQALTRLATEGQQFARSSEEQQQQFITLADCLPHLVFQTDAHGKVEYMSSQWPEELGISSLIFLNDLSVLIHPEDTPTFASLWQTSMASGTDLSATVRIAKPKSEIFQWYRIRGKAVHDAHSKISKWIGTLTNVNQAMLDAERVANALENERRTRSEVERVSKMKDEFLATLSHELRTPLSVIGGWAQILENQEKGDETTIRAGAVIRRNVDLQARLISDLLDMSAVIAGKVILDSKHMDAVQIVEGVVQSMSKVASDKGIELRTALPETAMMFGDATRLTQILTNLLTNAIKFTEYGGTVSVSGKAVGQVLELQVKDTGSGIASDFLPHIFDRFRQEDASSTRKRGGLGLGLAIAKSLVELHEGTITAFSEGPGKGCVVTVRLPIMPSRFNLSDSATLSNDMTAMAHAVNVLLIDDDDDARDMAQELLLRFGAHVESAASARQGLACLGQTSFDIVLCDISMPEMDGYECIRVIRSHPDRAIASLPAIALTAFAMKQDQLLAKEAGFDLHVAKPFAANDLLTAITKTIAIKKSIQTGTLLEPIIQI